MKIEAGMLAAVLLFTGGKVVPIDREAYVTGVVAAEMPAIYEMDALRAQAVAARTYLAANHCASHPEADVCDNSRCCQAYLDEDARRARWGADHALYEARVAQAAEDTRGEIMTYAGEPILALYHAVSGGHTEDVERVFSEPLPYLRGVSSPGEESSSNYATTQFFSFDELDRLLGAHDPVILERSASGRVQLLRVGEREMDGRMLRGILGLKSTCFSITILDGAVRIDQLGYGHGVGMSQTGAQAMALAGEDYQTILKHYYTGIGLSRLGDAEDGRRD